MRRNFRQPSFVLSDYHPGARIVHCVVAKHPGGETCSGRTVQVAKRLGGETSRGRTVKGAKNAYLTQTHETAN